MGDVGAEDGWMQIIYTKDSESRMGGCWGRKWEYAERLYHANRAEDGRMRSVCIVPSEKSL